jgi:hypothetical protein
MTPRIIFEPIPIIFIFESLNFLAPFGIIQPNIRSMKLFFTRGALGFRKRFSPQKVQKTVAGFPSPGFLER